MVNKKTAKIFSILMFFAITTTAAIPSITATTQARPKLISPDLSKMVGYDIPKSDILLGALAQSNLNLQPISAYPSKPTYVPGDFLGPNAPNYVNYIKNAYNLPTDSNAGAGTTIVIISAYDDPTVIDDLNSFSTYFGLPLAVDGDISDPVITVFQIGPSIFTPPSPPSPNTLATWHLETSVDVQWAHAIAPGAKIVLLETASNLFYDLDVAPLLLLNFPVIPLGNDVYVSLTDLYENFLSQPVIASVSMSWGIDENIFTSAGVSPTYYDPLFANVPNHSQITYFAAVGDYGADPMHTNKVGNFVSSTSALLYPSVSPNVVAVGGTRLILDLTDGNKIDETASGYYVSPTGSVKDRIFLGGGGGVSRTESKPAFQEDYRVPYLNRTVPDVSYNMDLRNGFPIYYSFDLSIYGLTSPGWLMEGGTSCGTPQWAAIEAIALSSGSTGLNNAKLYQAAKTELDFYFNDITDGSNGYTAKRGYDLATGLGTPRNILAIP